MTLSYVKNSKICRNLLLPTWHVSERQSNYTKRKTNRRSYPRICQWPNEGVWDFYWKYAWALSPSWTGVKWGDASLLVGASFLRVDNLADAKHWGKARLFRSGLDVYMATYGESRTTAGHNVSGGCGPDSEVMGCELLASDWVNFDFYPAKTLVIYWKLAGGIKVVLLPKKLYIWIGIRRWSVKIISTA